MSASPPLDGTCAAGFAPVQNQLLSHLSEGHDVGASVAVFIDGELVVDLRGGYTDRKQTEPLGDQLFCIYSCGKAVTAALVLAAVSEGYLDYDRPIADDWPAFGAAGKEAYTLGDACSHQTGLSAFMTPIEPSDWLDWTTTAERLTAMAPLWPRGTASGYHPQTWGFIVGEVLRRATGSTVGGHLRALGVDVHCGLRPAAMARVRPMIKPPAAPDLGPPSALKRAAFQEKWSSPRRLSGTEALQAEIPASTMHATARGVADVMLVFSEGALGTFTINEAAREAALKERIHGPDLVLPFDLSWAAGVMRNSLGHYGPVPDAVGHYGFGGACTFADPTNRLSFAYVPNKMSPHLVADPRAMALIDAVYRSL